MKAIDLKVKSVNMVITKSARDDRKTMTLKSFSSGYIQVQGLYSARVMMHFMKTLYHHKSPHQEFNAHNNAANTG